MVPAERRVLVTAVSVASAACLLLAGADCALAQEAEGRVSGRVVAEVNSRPLAGVQVTLADLETGVLSDVDGRYSISRLPPGTYDLAFTRIGFASKTVTGVVVTAGEVTVVDVVLPPRTIAVEGITVSATKEQGTAAAVLSARQTAAAVTDAIGREQISDSPDSDAAAAMARVPGVTIVDKKFVYVRGLGERYGNTTLDGAVMPSPIADRKAVPLDLVPASFIESVSTSKSYLPSQPADYAGGLVQIETRRVPGEEFFKMGLSSGYQTITTGATGLSYEGGGLDFLGIDDGTRDLPDILPDDMGVTRGNLTTTELEAIGEAFAPGWAGLPSTVPAPVGGELAFSTEFGLGPRDLGILATAHWDDSWSRRGNYVERVFASSLLDDPEVNYAGDVTTRQVTLGGLLNVDYPLASGHRISLNGLMNRVTEDQARILEGFNLDSNADQRNTRLQYVENSLLSGRVTGKHYFRNLAEASVEWQASYSRAGRYEPNTREVLYREADGVFLWDNFIQSGSIFHQNLEEEAINLAMDAEIPIWVRDVPGTIEFGGALVSRDRDVLSRRFRFIPRGPIPDDVRMSDPDDLFTAENIAADRFEITEATFRPDNYVADQITAAAYFMADFELLPSLRFAGGARVESSKQNVNPLDLFTTFADPLEGAELSDTDIAPGITLTWAASDQINVRAAASRTVARPEFRELAPFSFADFAGGYLVVGNPLLERSRINNFDLRWEFFPSPGSVFSASAFLKEFAGPIEEVVFPSSEFIKSWVNAESAQNLGAEFEARTGMGFLAGGWDNLRLNVNVTVVASQVATGTVAQVFVPGFGADELEIVERERRLQGQSAYVVNAGLNWSAPGGGSSMSLLYNRFGSRISQVGTQYLPDVLEEPRDQLDFVVEQNLGRGTSLKMGASNLLDSSYRFTQGGDLLRGWDIGRSFSVSAEWQPAGNF